MAQWLDGHYAEIGNAFWVEGRVRAWRLAFARYSDASFERVFEIDCCRNSCISAAARLSEKNSSSFWRWGERRSEIDLPRDIEALPICIKGKEVDAVKHRCFQVESTIETSRVGLSSSCYLPMGNVIPFESEVLYRVSWRAERSSARHGARI